MSLRIATAFALLLLPAAASGGCSAASLPAREKPATAGRRPAEREELSLRLDEPTLLGNSQSELTWVEVRDSRCPLGAQCIWAGEVEASLEIRTSRGEEPRRLVLILPPQGRSGEADRDVAIAEGWRLRLLAVDPRPRNGVATQRSQYRLRLEVISAADSP